MPAQKSAPLRLLAAVAFLSAGLACNISSAGTNGSNPPASGQAAPALSDFPEFSSFGDLATVLSNPITVAVGPEAGQVALDHGVKLVIPAGAFPSANQLQVVRIDVAFDHVAPDVSRGNYYLISAREDVPALGAPLLLEIPTTTTDFTVVYYDGSSWQPVQVTPAKTIQISIGHFSWSIWGFFEWWSSRDLQLGQTLDSMDSTDRSSKYDRRIESGDENVHTFFGVNEQASQTQEDICLDIQSTLEQYNTTANRTFPDTSASYDDMVKLLQDGSAPSDTGGPYWKLTEDSMEMINDRVLATTGQLSPAAFLKIAIDANNGNIPLGVLAAHNYLKNITYLGRLAFDKKAQVPATYGEPASHLASWRQSDNIMPATGIYDKMGPIYHIFAAMTGALWLPTRYAGHAIGGAEMYLRTFRDGQDRPDPSKAEADQCGIDSADWLRFHPASAVQPPATAGVDRAYQGQISTQLLLDPSDNTWKCDPNLSPYSFVLHFLPDDSIMMDTTQLNSTAIPTTFHFQPNSASPGRFDGSDATSSDYLLIFPNASTGDFSTLEFVETLNEANGNPGDCAYIFTQTAGSP